MKRLLKGFLFPLLILALLFSVSCQQETVHEHTFSKEWTYDGSSHWHAATCEHTDEVSGKDYHTWGSTKVTKAATITEKGSQTSTCTVCGATFVEELYTTIRMVMAGPGENASSQAVISWHASEAGSSLEYALDDSDSWTAVANEQCNETLSTADWRDTSGRKLVAKPYVCKVYLENLTPGSDYKYRVKDSSGNYSTVAHFKTADEDTVSFQFMWLSDIHTPKGNATYIKRVKELVDFANAKDGVDLDFVLFTGDMVNKGQIYKHWNYWSDSGYMNELTYAFVCGNHDYYGWDDKERTINDYYKAFAAYPANNDPEGDSYVLDSNYWFIWNRVLFVCIDNFTQESEKLNKLSGSSLSAQQAYFKAVVEANEGNYDYLIFAQHLPWYNTDTKYCDYGNYPSWRKIFDQYKVDFALSSDEHTYRRTYALYNNKNPNYVSETNPDVEKAEMIDGKVSKGTVYVTSNQTEGGSISGLKNEAKAGLKYVEYTAGGVGGVYFTVTPTEMTLHLIGSGGTEKDTITVLKKDRTPTT